MRAAGTVQDITESKEAELVISSVDQVPPLIRGDPVRFGPGGGSTFWFTAPFLPATGVSSPAMREGAVAGLRVLVVDDNATNRFILAEQLRAWDVDVTVAASAQEAFGELDGAPRRAAPTGTTWCCSTT